MEGLKERKCRTVKRLRNAMKSFHGKSDEQEMDRIIEEMMNTLYTLVNWLQNVNYDELERFDYEPKQYNKYGNIAVVCTMWVL